MATQSRLLLRAMQAQDADPRSVPPPIDFMRARSDDSEGGQQHETVAKELIREPFRVTVEDAEVVNESCSVTYNLVVHSAKGEHKVKKNYCELECLGEALMEELPTVMLPKLPRPRAREQLVDPGFRTRLGVYLYCLACNQCVVEASAFSNFFQLVEDAPLNLQVLTSATALGCAGQADGQTPHTGADCLLSSPRQGRPATSFTTQAATQAPLGRTAPQGPTSPPEPSATTIRDPLRRKTRRGRAWCVVCLENLQEMAIDPCGHMSMCEECMKSVKDCPVCRGPIHKAMKIIITKRHRTGETTEYVSW